jgi:high-affinity nickel-transport protein
MAHALALLLVGFVLGLRHATDSDHVVAVTTIVSRARTTRAAVAIGALWGLGHTATILLVGGAIVLFGIVIPPRLGLSMEMSVAGMLVVLGVMNLTGALRRIRDGAHAASHGATTHRVPAVDFGLGLAGVVRPVVVGVVHGLAGSAAVALLVLATVRDPVWAIFYLSVFGFGTVLGMMLLTSAMAVPIAAVARRSADLEQLLVRATGFVSISFGLILAYRIGISDGLLVGAPAWNPR